MEIPMMEDGEDHSPVISQVCRVYAASRHNRVGKLRDSKSYCENALRVYLKPSPGTLVEEVATAFIETSAMCQSMNELDKSIKMLTRAWKIYANAPGQQNTVAGIEAQRGVVDYVIEILEYVVGAREEKLGTANPEVEDEKQMLTA
ncbi:Tetratricopeptide repeat (TPR)-like superfamily protein [Raphanus sativus]|nr:Tetratricopeptide repeat (TPR)-like superfamily protein [Raphanus sativus]